MKKLDCKKLKKKYGLLYINEKNLEDSDFYILENKKREVFVDIFHDENENMKDKYRIQSWCIDNVEPDYQDFGNIEDLDKKLDEILYI